MKVPKYDIPSREYRVLYELLWHRIIELEYGGIIPPNTKEYAEKLFYHEKEGHYFSFWLLDGTKTADRKYFYRKYIEAVSKSRIYFDELLLYNVLVYLGYKASEQDRLIREVSDKDIKTFRDHARAIVNQLRRKFWEANSFLLDVPDGEAEVESAKVNEEVLKEQGKVTGFAAAEEHHKNTTETTVENVAATDQGARADSTFVGTTWNLPTGVAEAFTELTAYYERYKKMEPQEAELFQSLSDIVQRRVAILNKDVQEVKAYRSYAMKLLGSPDGWEWYERSGEKIIKKIVLFSNFGPEIDRDEPENFEMFFSINKVNEKNEEDSIIRGSGTMIQDIITLMGSSDKDSMVLECTNIKFPFFDIPETLIGHKITINGNSGELYGRLVALRKHKNLHMTPVQPSSEELPLSSPQVPAYIRSILCSPRETGIRVNPYENVFHTLIKLSGYFPLSQFLLIDRGNGSQEVRPLKKLL